VIDLSKFTISHYRLSSLGTPITISVFDHSIMGDLFAETARIYHGNTPFLPRLSTDLAHPHLTHLSSVTNISLIWVVQVGVPRRALNVAFCLRVSTHVRDRKSV